MQNKPTNYDLVSYPSYTHPQTHPDRLAVIGSLFGLEPAPTDNCHVLELGCGNGSNLVPMAAGLPNSKFVGIDLATHPIEYGQKMIHDLGMNNGQLIQGNITKLDSTGENSITSSRMGFFHGCLPKFAITS